MTAPDSRDSVELLPCPFCGHDESLYIEHVEGTILHPAYYVRCDYCGAQNGSTDKGDHVQQWNRRALARGPQQAGGEDAPPCPVWLAGKDVSHAWAAGWNARNPHYAALQAEVARWQTEAMETANYAAERIDAAEAALRLAHSHLDMPALRVSHCKDAAAIDAALNGGQQD